jgi:hypothetical protein
MNIVCTLFVKKIEIVDMEIKVTFNYNIMS